MYLLERPAAEQPVDFFDLDTWFDKNSHNSWAAVSFNDNRCGTSACACGLAAMDPEFQKQGLKLVPYDGGGQKLNLHYRGATDMCAASLFFGVSMDNAYNLFAPGAYECEATPNDVARRIRILMMEEHGHV